MAKQATDQMREEIHSIIKRYGAESDVTVYAVIGLLEVIKADVLEMLTESTGGGE